MISIDSGDSLIEVRRKAQANFEETVTITGYSGTIEALVSGMGLKEFRDACRLNMEAINTEVPDSFPVECFPVNGDMLGDVRRKLNCAFGNPKAPVACTDLLAARYLGGTNILGEEVWLTDSVSGNDAQCFGYELAFAGATRVDFAANAILTGSFTLTIRCVPTGEGTIVGGGDGSSNVLIRINASGAIEYITNAFVRATSTQDSLFGEKVHIVATRGPDNKFYLTVNDVLAPVGTFTRDSDMTIRTIGCNRTTTDDFLSGTVGAIQVKDGFGTETYFWTTNSGSDTEQAIVYDCTGGNHGEITGPIAFTSVTDEPYLIHYGYSRIQNQLLWSADFTNAVWVKSDITIDTPAFGWNTISSADEAGYLQQTVTVTGDVIGATLEMSAGVSTTANIGFFDTSYSGMEYFIIEGPGSVSIDADGSALVSGLTNVPTLLAVQKSNPSGTAALRLRPHLGINFRGMRVYPSLALTGYRVTEDAIRGLEYIPASRVNPLTTADGYLNVPIGDTLITGGDFSDPSSIDEWLSLNSSLSLIDDNLNIANVTTIAGWAYQPFTFVLGATYYYEYTIALGPGTSMAVRVGESSTGANWLTNGNLQAEGQTHRTTFVARAESGYLMFGCGSSIATANRNLGGVSLFETDSAAVAELSNPPGQMTVTDVGFFKLPEVPELIAMDAGVEYFFDAGGNAKEITGRELLLFPLGNYSDQYFYGPPLYPELICYEEPATGDCLSDTEDYIRPNLGTGVVTPGTSVLLGIGNDGSQYGYKRNNYGSLSPDDIDDYSIRALRTAGPDGLRMRFINGDQVPGVQEFNCKLLDRDIQLTWDGGSYSGYSTGIRAALAAEDGTTVTVVITKGV